MWKRRICTDRCWVHICVFVLNTWEFSVAYLKMTFLSASFKVCVLV
jgi:hypothetical protein